MDQIQKMDEDKIKMVKIEKRFKIDETDRWKNKIDGIFIH